MLKEFREFINRGNVIDLAVAVIIGAAFSAIVTSLIEDIITPAILNPVMSTVGADRLAELSFNGILYGNFLAAVLNFLVIAVVVFLLVRAVNVMQKQKEKQPEAPEFSTEEKLLMEIRDLLKKR
jgi:large conductance mechanosensitive channel